MRHRVNKNKKFKIKPFQLLVLSSLPILTNCASNTVMKYDGVVVTNPSDGVGGTGNIAIHKLDGMGGTGDVASRCDERQNENSDCKPFIAPNNTEKPDVIKPDIKLVEKPNNPAPGIPKTPDGAPNKIEIVNKPPIEKLPTNNLPDGSKGPMLAPLDIPKPKGNNKLNASEVPPQLPKPANKPYEKQLYILN